MMYWATWVHVTDFMPPSTEQNSTPSRPTNTPTLKSRPMKRDDDQADAGHLGDEVRERARDGADDADDPRGMLPP